MYDIARYAQKPPHWATHVRLSLLLTCMVVVALVCAPASTNAEPLGWFGPILPNSTGGSGERALAVACPSTTQCTTVDNQGQQVTFDPSNPGVLSLDLPVLSGGEG